MKHIQTTWRITSAQSPVHRESCLGFLVAEIETDFPISCSFVVLPEYRQRVLVWLETKAVGPYSVEVLPDRRFGVALGDRHDAVGLQEHHRHCLDQDVIVANRSAEQVNGFIRQIKRGLAS